MLRVCDLPWAQSSRTVTVLTSQPRFISSGDTWEPVRVRETGTHKHYYCERVMVCLLSLSPFSFQSVSPPTTVPHRGNQAPQVSHLFARLSLLSVGLTCSGLQPSTVPASIPASCVALLVTSALVASECFLVETVLCSSLEKYRRRISLRLF